MIIGFTGTSKGMTPKQRATFRAVLQDMIHKSEIEQFHHGDGIGSDAEAHDIVKETLGDAVAIHIHPSTLLDKRAYKQGDVTYPKKDLLDRNNDIVDIAEWMIAAPKGTEEEIRSSTWATIRYARVCAIPLTIIYPDGETANFS